MTEKCKHEKGDYIGKTVDTTPRWKCKKCGLALTEEEFSRGEKQVNMSKLDEPIICPLLSMACPKEEEFTNCMKEACWFYSRTLKKCAVVHMAISLADLAHAQAKGDLEQILPSMKDRIIKSVNRQHRSLDE